MDEAVSRNLTDGCASDGSSGEGGLGEVLAGVAIAVVASVGINIGNNVQVLPGLRCIRSQGGLGWPGIGVRVRVRGGLRLQGFASIAAQPAPPEGSASGQSLAATVSAVIKPRLCAARAQALGLKMRIAAKGTEEKKAGKPAGSKPGDGDMKLEEITSEVETGYTTCPEG